MTNVATQTDFEWIAGLRCWNCGKPHDFARCSECGSYRGKTILGYRFPWLWRKCGKCNGWGFWDSSQWKEYSTYVNCWECGGSNEEIKDEPRLLPKGYNGTGYVLIDSERTDALLKVKTLQYAHHVKEWNAEASEYEWVWSFGFGEKGTTLQGVKVPDNDSFQDALAQAIRKALEA